MFSRKTPRKLCSHDDCFYKFLLRDADGKFLKRLNGDVLLEDFKQELRNYADEICTAKNLPYYYPFYDRIYAGKKFISIDTQNQLKETLEFTKYCGPMPLFLGTPLPLKEKFAEISAECMQCRENKKKCNKILKSIRSNSEYEVDEIFHQALRIASTNFLDSKLPEKKQKELNDTTVDQSSNQLHDSDTVPLSWFKEYMETVKYDMVCKITHEVSKKVTKKLIKHLDPFLQRISNEQSQSRNTSSPLKRDTPCSFEPIEKNQGQKMSQDEEQSSDALIERMEELQNAERLILMRFLTAKDVQVTKDEKSTVNSKKIVQDISEMLNKTSVNPIAFVPSKNHEKSGNLIKKNGKETTPQIEEQLSDKVSAESQNATTAKDPQLDEVKFIKDKIREFVLEEEKMLKKHHQRDAQIATDNLENCDAKSQEKSDENLFTANPQLRSMRSADWKPAQIGYHMSCSVTGHQMLDETLQNKGMWSGRCSDADDVDKTSFCSCDQEEDDDDAFEIIQIPASETEDSFTHLEEPVAEQQRHDSNRDSPSFELLTEPSSPCSIYITEDHFAASEGKSDEKDPQSNNNNPTNCGGHQPEFDKSVKSMNTDLEKRTGDGYSFVTETLPAQDSNSFCKSLRTKQRSNEGKYSRDNGSGDENSFAANPKLRLIRPADWSPERSVPEDTCGLYDDVRNSHTSYLTVQTHCDCQSQCANSGDLTQSFHSHTTSINDITDVSHRLIYTDNSHSSQMPSTDAQDAAAIPKSSLDPHVGNDRVKNARTNERHNADNDPKCLESAAQDVYTDAQRQFHRANSGFSDRSSSNDGSGRAFAAEQSLGTADSVHILPETLVNAAAQVGSYAYDAAREVFDKIRAHAKEDSTKRRNGTKSDHKKPFGNLPFI